MQREEARQRLAGDDRATEQDLHELQADERHAAHDRRADAESPVRVLIPAQDLAGEGHAQRHQQEKDAGQPRQLARILVGPEQQHLHHVEQDDRHHEVRAPPVHRAQEPAERLLEVEDEEAGVRLAGRRDVDERQADARHHLQR